MKNTLSLIFLFLISFAANSQSFYKYKFEAPWSASVSAGPTQYFGELYSFWNYQEGIQADWNVNVALRKTLTPRFKARADITYYQISGSDVPADPRSDREARNLSFRANNWEASLIGEFHLIPSERSFNYSRSTFNFYGFAGIGVTSNDPQAQLNDRWIDLRPLQLENNPYGKYVVTIPTGLGMKYRLNAIADLTLEMNYRWTVTDYLDDISAFNIEDFYLDLINDYGVNGNGPQPDRLRLAVRNPAFYKENGEPDVQKILDNGGKIRRGSGLDNRFDGFVTFNIGLEVYLSRSAWNTYHYRNKNKKRLKRF